MLDIFNTNAFSVVTLSMKLDQFLFIPGRIGELGIFTEGRVNDPRVAIEERSGVLVLIPPTERGAPGTTVPRGGRTLRLVMVPHFEVNDHVMAEEVQGVRAWGTETELETVLEKIAERDQVVVQSLAVTQEYARLGALTGVVTYADGSTLDLFSLMGVTQEAEIDFDLDNPTPVLGALRGKVDDVFRLMAKNIGGLPFTGIRAFVGDQFYRDLVSHPEVREITLAGFNTAFALAQAINPNLRANSSTFGSFEWGGIIWENYRGQVGSTAFIDTNKAYFFPEGAPGFAQTLYAPADYMETVNTLGQRLYQKSYPMNNGKGQHFDTQMNSLEFVTRPKALIKGRRT